MNICLIDTETTGTLQSPQIFDFGFIIFDNKGKIIFEDNYLIKDIFEDCQKMANAFCIGKIKQYYNGILNGDFLILDFYQAMAKFKAVCANYNVKVITAYNLNFDLRAIQATKRATNSYMNLHWMEKIDKWDIWKMSKQLICNTKKYSKYCKKHNYLTTTGRDKTSAEVVYRYINKKNNFIEAHTALEDCFTEYNILMNLLKKHKKFPKGRF